MKDFRCKIELTETGIRFEGNCATELARTYDEIFDISRELDAEISMRACINPQTGKVESFEIDTIGNPMSTMIRGGRRCQKGQMQITSHTHPRSGIAKFSRQDSLSVVERMNEGIDEGHCVIGVEEKSCLIYTKLPRRS